MFDAPELADRYAAVWNETNSERRRSQIAALWVPEARHYVGVREVLGYAGLAQRIADSHNKNVRDEAHHFRAVKDARTLRDIVVFHWEMLPTTEDRVAAHGFIVLRVDADGRILVDYQFVL
jgi:predicted glycosyl hydrolase (DUF1957 family)